MKLSSTNFLNLVYRLGDNGRFYRLGVSGWSVPRLDLNYNLEGIIMTAQHFKEMVESIQITMAITENELGRAIGYTGDAIRWWKKNGLPVARTPLVCSRLRAFMRS
jgi:hypothetical protein